MGKSGREQSGTVSKSLHAVCSRAWNNTASKEWIIVVKDYKGNVMVSECKNYTGKPYHL